MSYDAWKTTDPADTDPYIEDRCPRCRQVECDPDCGSDRERDADDGVQFSDPRDERDARRFD